MAPPKLTRMDRAKQERMYFMGRAASSSESAASFIVTGQSGKVWTVTIPKKNSSAAASSSRMSRFRCNCPDNIIRRVVCKHQYFICLRVLKISEEQLAGLENGAHLDVNFLHEVLEKVAPEVDEEYAAPAALKERLKAIAGDFESGGQVPKVEPRLPEEGDSCPICIESLTDGLELTHCGYGCGKAVHAECFERYTKAQYAQYSKNEVADNKLRCVTCRMDWVVEPAGVVGPRGMLMGRRAINLADSMPEQFMNIGSSSKKTTKSKSKRKSTKTVSKKKATTSKKTTSKKTNPGTRRSQRTAGATTSKAGGVRSGRVTKVKGERQSKRIAKRVKQESTVTRVKNEPATSKRTRKSLARKVKTESKTVAKKVSPSKVRTVISKRKTPSKIATGWVDAVGTEDTSAIANGNSARNARAARRSAGRVTRNMV